MHYYCCYCTRGILCATSVPTKSPCAHYCATPHTPRHVLASLRCFRSPMVQNNQNQPKIRLLDVISRIFPSKFQQIHLISVSSHCKRFIFKIRQTVAGTSITSRFHDFFKSHFWRVFAIWPKYLQLGDRAASKRKRMCIHAFL